MRLAGKKAVVTGGSSGIGRAVAIEMAKQGASVAVNYRRSRAAADDCVSAIENIGAQAKSFQANVADVDEVNRLVEQTHEYLGGIDIWANVAGADILTGLGAELSDQEKLQSLLNVDLQGTINCCWAVAERLQQAESGAIVNMSWDLALRGMGGRNPEMFAAVKAGITGFTRSFARSVAPHIRVNEIAPGWIATAFAENDMSDDYRKWVTEQTPLARFGTPEDIAHAVVFLSSEEASFITGQTLQVNGGLSS